MGIGRAVAHHEARSGPSQGGHDDGRNTEYGDKTAAVARSADVAHHECRRVAFAAVITKNAEPDTEQGLHPTGAGAIVSAGG